MKAEIECRHESMHLATAPGWLEAGNSFAANKELEKIVLLDKAVMSEYCVGRSRETKNNYPSKT